MSRKGVTCRFRKGLDADLIAATEQIAAGELSEMARNGLRLMLGIRTAKTMEVRERPLQIPSNVPLVQSESVKPAAPAALFISQKGGR